MKELFSEQEWDLLQKTPAIVLSMVAAADGKVDNKELNAFSNFCSNKNVFRSDLIKIVLPNDSKKYIDDVLPKIDKSKIKDTLREIDLTLDMKVNPVESKAFKHHLIALGVYIANSSGKMFQHNISEEEDEAINKFAKYIDIDAAQLFKTTLVDEILQKVE